MYRCCIDQETGEKYGWGRVLDYIGVEWEDRYVDWEKEQMSIFDFQTKQEEQSVKNQKHQKLDKALDVIRKKYGEDAVKKGTLLK